MAKSFDQQMLSGLSPADLQAVEDHQLDRWNEQGCRNFPNCTSGKCNPGCDLEDGDAKQWGEG